MHILGIYMLYSAIISSLGFVISLVLTLTINSILSLSFQEDVIYLLSAGATNRSVDKVFLLLVGNAWVETILIYFITVAVSLLAAIIPSIRATRIEPIVVLKND
jgi:ABC-type antimicrobial peptide transport system permease subunit